MLHLLLILFIRSALAQDVCTDLKTRTCAPDTATDPTGSVLGRADYEAKLQRVKDAVQADAKPRFKIALTRTDSDYFRRVALAVIDVATGECTERASEGCAERLADALAMVATTQLLKPPQQTIREFDLSGLVTLMEDSTYEDVTSAVAAGAKKALAEPAAESKVEAIFPKVRAALIERISSWDLPDEAKKTMLSRIKSIRFGGSECGNLVPAASHDRSLGIGSLLVPNAFYDPRKNIFKFCGGFLGRTDSEFTMAFVIAHELSHSVDPCSITLGPRGTALDKTPFQKIVECLRRPTSAQAAVVKHPFGRADDVCLGDQIGEAFADWLGTEAGAAYFESAHEFTKDQYRDGYANVLKVPCGFEAMKTEQETKRDFHPSIEKRINALLLVNPVVRRQMGCPPTHPKYLYCSLDDSNGATPTPPSPAPTDSSR